MIWHIRVQFTTCSLYEDHSELDFKVNFPFNRINLKRIFLPTKSRFTTLGISDKILTLHKQILLPIKSYCFIVSFEEDFEKLILIRSW